MNFECSLPLSDNLHYRPCIVLRALDNTRLQFSSFLFWQNAAKANIGLSCQPSNWQNTNANCYSVLLWLCVEMSLSCILLHCRSVTHWEYNNDWTDLRDCREVLTVAQKCLFGLVWPDTYHCRSWRWWVGGSGSKKRAERWVPKFLCPWLWGLCQHWFILSCLLVSWRKSPKDEYAAVLSQTPPGSCPCWLFDLWLKLLLGNIWRLQRSCICICSCIYFTVFCPSSALRISTPSLQAEI